MLYKNPFSTVGLGISVKNGVGFTHLLRIKGEKEEYVDKLSSNL